MARTAAVSVSVAREKALARYERLAAAWATDQEGPPSPVLDLPLHPPSEADVLADAAAAVAWVGSWRPHSGVMWGRRTWASVGDQEVPERLVFAGPGELARFVGLASHWTTVSSRARDLIERCGDAVRPVVRRHARTVVEHDGDDYDRLVAAVTWLIDHPRSGLYLRQLPIEGLGTKWIEARQSLVTGLVTAVTGEGGLGLADPPALVRVRALDPTLVPEGPADLAAPVAELDRWAIRARHVVVVENLQTYLALPPLPRTMAIHGAGYAVDLLGQVSWVRDARVVYWGDLDRDGFAILNRLRAHIPAAVSVLMDEATLLEHRHLWTADPTRDSNAALNGLTPAEQRTLDLTREYGGVRLEQERLAWPRCVAALRQAVGAVQSAG